MFRIKHLIPTAAVVIASAGVLAPAALAGPDGLSPQSERQDQGHPHRRPRLAARAPLGAWVHDTPLANPVEPKIAPKVVVTGRTTPITGGIDWTFPVMGAVALGLIIMIAGDQIVVRRRGQLAT